MPTAQSRNMLYKIEKIFIVFLLIVISKNVFAQKQSRQEIVIDSLMAKNKNTEAVNYLQKEIKLKPYDDKLFRLLGYVHLYTNDLINAEIDYKKAITLNAKCNRCYLNLARLYAIQNDANKALEAIDNSISICDTDASAYVIRGNIYEMKNDELSALSNYDKAIELAPNTAEYYQARAMYNKNQHFEGIALDDISKAIELDIKNDSYYYTRSEIYFALGKMYDALDDINIAITMNNKNAAYYNARAAINSGLKNEKDVVIDYNKAIAMEVDNYFAYYNLGGEYYRKEDMENALLYMKKSLAIIEKNKLDVKEKPEILNIINSIGDRSKASYYYQRGIAFYNLNKMDDAIKIYNEGVKNFQNNALLLIFRGNAFIHNKQYEECIMDYEKALENKNNLKAEIKLNATANNPLDENYENELIASTYSSIAEAYLALYNFDKAYLNINKGLYTPNKNIVVGKENYYRLRGEINMANNKIDAAIKDFDSSLKINANQVPALISKATALIYKINKIGSRSIGANIKNSEIPLSLRWELPLKLNGKIADLAFNEAMVLIQKAIALEENNADAFYVRGVLHYMDYNNKEFCIDMAKAKTLGRVADAEYDKLCK
jgi:tetratricopeptide (TPR) repeat protein